MLYRDLVILVTVVACSSMTTVDKMTTYCGFANLIFDYRMSGLSGRCRSYKQCKGYHVHQGSMIC